jgi:HD domain
VNQADWAAELARTLLEVPLPRRWAHVQGVAGQACALAPILGDDSELLEASAWLHDIGYSPDVVDTGFHPLDGARYLRDVQHADPTLCSLVAHHSCAIIEAAERGLADELANEFPAPDPRLSDALAYCDMTTTPTGNVVSVNDRISEIVERYGPQNVVTRFIRKAEPSLISSVARTSQRLCLAHRGFSQRDFQLIILCSNCTGTSTDFAMSPMVVGLSMTCCKARATAGTSRRSSVLPGIGATT